jgi:hypothetical protein
VHVIDLGRVSVHEVGFGTKPGIGRRGVASGHGKREHFLVVDLRQRRSPDPEPDDIVVLEASELGPASNVRVHIQGAAEINTLHRLGVDEDCEQVRVGVYRMLIIVADEPGLVSRTQMTYMCSVPGVLK